MITVTAIVNVAFWKRGSDLIERKSLKRKGLVGEIKIDSLPSVSDFLCFLPLLLFNEICASPSLHVLFIYSIFFHSFSGSFFVADSLIC